MNAAFSSPASGWVALNLRARPTIAHLTRGNRWQTIQTPLHPRNASANIVAISAKRAWITAATPETPYIYITDDGGHSWHRHTIRTTP